MGLCSLIACISRPIVSQSFCHPLEEGHTHIPVHTYRILPFLLYIFCMFEICLMSSGCTEGVECQRNCTQRPETTEHSALSFHALQPYAHQHYLHSIF